MAEKDITSLNNKVENEGTTSRGRLSAAEFNLLVDAAIESQSRIETIEDYFVPISEEEYENLVESGELEERPYFIYEEK